MAANNDHIPLEVELENFTCDLLSVARNQPALQRLFRARKGTWLPMTELCAKVPGLPKAFRALSRQLDSELMVTWLDYPFEGPENGSVLVLFFVEALIWTKAGIFNRDTLPALKRNKPKGAKASR